MWQDTQTFLSMNSLLRATELPKGYCAESLNSDLGSSSQAAPMKGYARYGRQANASNGIVRKFTYQKGDGVEILLQVRDNGTNYIVEYLNEEDIRNSTQGEWSILEAGLSRTRTLSDTSIVKARFGFAPFNDTGTNQLVYGNGVETPRIWNGAMGKISASTATTITMPGGVAVTTKGFAASGSLRINGTTYTYSGNSGAQFTGVSPDPTGEAIGSGIAQAVNTSTLSGAPNGSIFLAAQGRLFIAGVTATPNEVDFSDVSDITNYAGSTPSDGGLEDFPDLNGEITNLSYIDDWVFVFSEKKTLAFKFQFPTSTTKVTIRKNIADEGAASHKAVQKIGDKILYITPAGGLKQLIQAAAVDVFSVVDLTEAIRPTIKGFTWNDGVLGVDLKNKVILMAGKSDSSFTDNDKLVMLWQSTDGLGNQRFNLGISDIFMSDGCVFKEDFHFGQGVSSRNFRLFDGYSKDGAPMIWRRVERVELFGNAWEKKYVQFLGVRGEISGGTTLTMILKYGINGSVSSQTCSLVGTNTSFVVQQPLNVLGGFALGTEPLGGTVENIGELNPFSVIFELPHIYDREVQLQFSTDGAGQRVAVDSYGLFVIDAEQQVTASELKALG